MRTLHDQLKQNTVKRAAKYRELVALAEEQQDILVSGRHDDLIENIARHDPILADIEAIDRREREIVALVDEPTLAAISSDSELGIASEETIESVTKLRTIVESNTRLLRNAAEFVDFSMKIISRMGAEQASYDSQATADANKTQALMLDLKV